MLFVGGPWDGRYEKIVNTNGSVRVDYCDEKMVSSGFYTLLDLKTTRYTRRTYINNNRDRSFTVWALDSLSGDEVMYMLATGNYKNNPLKWAENT